MIQISIVLLLIFYYYHTQNSQSQHAKLEQRALKQGFMDVIMAPFTMLSNIRKMMAYGTILLGIGLIAFGGYGYYSSTQ